MQTNWADTYTVHLSPDFSVNLPLLDIGDGFCIYSFDMTGEAQWNRVAAAQLKEKEIPPVRWIVEDLLPVGLAMIAAPPKYYKSYMALDLSVAVAVGQDGTGLFAFVNYNVGSVATLIKIIDAEGARDHE